MIAQIDSCSKVFSLFDWIAYYLFINSIINCILLLLYLESISMWNLSFCHKGFDENFPKHLWFRHIYRTRLRRLLFRVQRVRRQMNERTQARRVIHQRGPLRPAAGAVILPDQFAVDPHPQLFDRKSGGCFFRTPQQFCSKNRHR